jgi:hypothetical protein
MAPGSRVKKYKMCINGDWVGSESGVTIDVVNPADERVVSDGHGGGSFSSLPNSMSW